MFKRLLYSNGKGSIFALSTPLATSAIAITRVSGPLANKLFPLSKPNYAKLTTLKDETGMVIDTAIVTYFKAPHSYTGEDVIEIATHGSLAVIKKLHDFIHKQGCRYADKGEFTYRALLNSKMSTEEIEKLDLLIHSETELQRKMALCGSALPLVQEWKQQLTSILAENDAYIEFEEDGIVSQDLSKLDSIIKEMESVLKDSKSHNKLKEGIKVTVCGCPNAGKSSLINLLCQEEISIVSDIKGTTRDVIRQFINFNHYPLTFIDTAGLWDTSDAIEQAGITKAYQIIKNSDILLFIVDPSQPLEHQYHLYNQISSYTNCIITIINKCDKSSILPHFHKDQIVMSCTSLKGLDTVKSTLLHQLQLSVTFNNNISLPSRFNGPLTKLIHLLKQAQLEQDSCIQTHYIEQSLQLFDDFGEPVNIEQVLDTLFKNFCIGK